MKSINLFLEKTALRIQERGFVTHFAIYKYFPRNSTLHVYGQSGVLVGRLIDVSENECGACSISTDRCPGRVIIDTVDGYYYLCGLEENRAVHNLNYEVNPIMLEICIPEYETPPSFTLIKSYTVK